MKLGSIRRIQNLMDYKKCLVGYDTYLVDDFALFIYFVLFGCWRNHYSIVCFWLSYLTFGSKNYVFGS